ncbi:MAG: peptidoglycan DD-metalloendopeptidase family protein [Rickettsiales bacterium]
MVQALINARFTVALWLITLLSVVINIYFIIPKVRVTLPPVEQISEDFVEPVTEPTSTTLAITKGDTLLKILSNNNVSTADAARIIDSFNKVFTLSKLHIGDKITLEPAAPSVLATGEIYLPRKMTIVSDTNEIITHYIESEDYFETKVIPIELLVQTRLVSGAINGSLFSAAKSAGADTNIIMSFINLYSYNVDFQRDIKAGDEFKIYYEFKTDRSGRKFKDPKIVYASLTTGKEQKDIFLYQMSNGKIDYFDKTGHSIRKALLRTPVNGARISSQFGMRKHPVLGYSKMHQGLDYSAPTGTPILASGDAVVQAVKSQSNGYGKHVQLKHNSTHVTLYAHMSKFASGIKPGIRVKQGQVIGYVGSTGMATGPHLHYEVIQSGKKINPSKVVFPKVPPLAGNELERFKRSILKFENVLAVYQNQFSNKVA